MFATMGGCAATFWSMRELLCDGILTKAENPLRPMSIRRIIHNHKGTKRHHSKPSCYCLIWVVRLQLWERAVLNLGKNKKYCNIFNCIVSYL
jgi:hypothetical protein